MKPIPTRDNPGVIAPPPLLFAAGIAAGLMARKIQGGPVISVDSWWPLGVLLVAAGVALAVWALHTLRVHDTAVDPSQATTTLVTQGPYQHTRNPIYVAMTTVIVGLAIIDHNLWIILFLVPVLVVMHYGVIRREEHYLQSKFGTDYEQYRAHVRRWL